MMTGYVGDLRAASHPEGSPDPVTRTLGEAVAEQGVPEALVAIMDLHAARGMAPLNDQPGGIGRYPIDENWYAVMNGTRDTVEIVPEGGMPVAVPGWTLAVWWNGWLAGLIDPAGGEFAAHPDEDGANEDHFIRACRLAARPEEEAP